MHHAPRLHPSHLPHSPVHFFGGLFTSSFPLPPSLQSDERQEQGVAQAMREAGERLPPEHKRWALGGHFFICSPTIREAHVVCAEPGFSDSLQTFPSLDGSL